MTPQPTQQTTKALKPIDELRTNLSAMSRQFQMVLPPHVPPERFLRVVMTAVQAEPKLLDCNRATLFSACMKAATDGLLPDGREGAIVPFKGSAQWMPMVGGILKKVRNSGELAAITAQIVFQNDRFRYWVDSDGEHIEHEPLLFEARGDIIGVYALAKTKDGAIYVEPMSKAQVEQVRAVSAARNNGPWVDWWEEMAKKTAIRRLSKRLPMSTDKDEEAVRRVIESDDEHAMLEPASSSAEVTTASGEPPGTKVKKKSRMETAVEASVSDLPEDEKLPFEKDAPTTPSPEVQQ